MTLKLYRKRVSKYIWLLVFKVCGLILMPHIVLNGFMVPLASLSVLANEITPQIVEQITVRIDSSGSYGSGVIVDRSHHSFYVLTNAHVVDRPDSYQIVTADGKVHSANSRKIIPGLDLALLSFESNSNYATAVMETANAGVSSKIWVGGWSKSGGSLRQPIFVATRGNITAINSDLPLGYALTYNNLVRAGMSGGPIINQEGKLIGINGVVRLEDGSQQIVASGIPIQRYWQWRSQLTKLDAANLTPSSVNQHPSNTSSFGYILAQTLSTKAAINSVAFDPVNRNIISGSSDGTIAVWQLGQDRSISRWQNSSAVNEIAVSPDGQILASGGEDGNIRIWNAATGQAINTFKGHPQTITSLVFSPEGKFLISSGWERDIKIWNPHTGKLIKTLPGHSQIINAIAISSDGKILASGDQDKTVSIWNLTTGNLIDVFAGHSVGVVSLAISPDNNFIASGSGDGIIKIWDLNTKKLIHTLDEHTDGVWSLAIAGDNQTLFSASWDKTIKVWDINAGTLKQTLTGHQDYIASLSFDLESQTLASGDFQGKIYIWKLSL